MMIGADASRTDNDKEDLEFSVRWINTPAGFRSPEPDDVPEIEDESAEPVQ